MSFFDSVFDFATEAHDKASKKAAEKAMAGINPLVQPFKALQPQNTGQAVGQAIGDVAGSLIPVPGVGQVLGLVTGGIGSLIDAIANDPEKERRKEQERKRKEAQRKKDIQRGRLKHKDVFGPPGMTSPYQNAYSAYSNRMSGGVS